MLLQKFLSRALGLFQSVRTGGTHLVKKFGWIKITLAALLLIILGWTIVYFISGSAPAEVASNQTRTVSLKTVAELSSGSTPLSVAGGVSSKSEASVRAEAGGSIVAVHYALGDYVAAGAVVAQTESASQRAAVAQAQGAVDAASAGASISQSTLSSAKTGAVNALLSAYGTVDKTIHTDTDPMFSNPNSGSPQFKVLSSNSQSKIDTESLRIQIPPILAREESQSATLSSSADLTAELQTTQKELRQVRDFLDAVIKTLNSGIAANDITETTIATYLATANASRSAAVTALSALAAAEASIETAQKGASTGSGASAAALAQAQAGLASARASLEKTVVRAPISGTINSLSLKVGNYLSAGSVAVVIANNGALEVTAYITDTDAREVSVGAQATIETQDGTVAAVVTRVAPAIDPATKKIEVRVGIVGGASKLVNGQSVTVDIARAAAARAGASARITLPLSSLKVGADSISIFTVDENGKLVPHLVTLGTLLGDRVVIESGVTADMKLVVDARGLQPGQSVIVK